jgi:hypothetical protein
VAVDLIVKVCLCLKTAISHVQVYKVVQVLVILCCNVASFNWNPSVTSFDVAVFICVDKKLVIIGREALKNNILVAWPKAVTIVPRINKSITLEGRRLLVPVVDEAILSVDHCSVARNNMDIHVFIAPKVNRQSMETAGMSPISTVWFA